ncbi:MAG: hypothetical protein H0V64_15150 [Geodermatophilaceae bacterium]|nr:hypothetical protein [Geodermatophilaceae bacterium]
MPPLSLQDAVLVLTCAAVVFLPGLVVARAAGLRGWTSVGAAPVISYGIAATAGPLTSVTGIGWGPLTMLAATGGLAGVCYAFDRWSRRRSAGVADRPEKPGPAVDRRGDRFIAAGVLAAAVLGGVAMLRGIGGLEAVHQGWDAGFHANAVRFIIDTGNASPVALSAINNYEDDSFFYPNAHHVLTSIVGRLTGSSIPSLLNTQMLVLPGIAGLGLAVLVRAFGGRVALAASVPLVLASFHAFPYDLVSRGPLLPYATGVALIPAFLALLNQALVRSSASVVIATAVAATGLLAVHPSTALTTVIFTVPLLVHRWRTGRAEVRRADARTLCGIAAVAVTAGLPFIVGTVAVGESGAVVDWSARQDFWEAVTGLVLLDHSGDGSQLWLVALLVVGVVHVRGLRQLWWWLAAAGLFAALFVAVSSTDAPVFETVTQPWWNDRWRLLALVILAMAVVAAHGAVAAGDALAGLVKRLAPEQAVAPRVRLAAAMVAVLAAFGVLSNFFYLPANEHRVSASYEDQPSVTSGEETAMRTLAEFAGTDGRVMNDPGDGSTWMYALEGVRPVFGHVADPLTFETIGQDQQLLLSAFHCLDSSPRVRQLVDKYDIRYVFTGKGYLRDHFDRIPGLRDLRMVDSLELLYARDGTAIYRVRLVALASESAEGLGCEDALRAGTQPLIAWI